jgi:hypothetical protein
MDSSRSWSRATQRRLEDILQDTVDDLAILVKLRQEHIQLILQQPEVLRRMDDVIINAERAIAYTQGAISTNAATRRTRINIFSKDKGGQSPAMREKAAKLEETHRAIISELYRVQTIGLQGGGGIASNTKSSAELGPSSVNTVPVELSAVQLSPIELDATSMPGRVHTHTPDSLPAITIQDLGANNTGRNRIERNGQAGNSSVSDAFVTDTRSPPGSSTPAANPLTSQTSRPAPPPSNSSTTQARPVSANSPPTLGASIFPRARTASETSLGSTAVGQRPAVPPKYGSFETRQPASQNSQPPLRHMKSERILINANDLDGLSALMGT